MQPQKEGEISLRFAHNPAIVTLSVLVVCSGTSKRKGSHHAIKSTNLTVCNCHAFTVRRHDDVAFSLHRRRLIANFKYYNETLGEYTAPMARRNVIFRG